MWVHLDLIQSSEMSAEANLVAGWVLEQSGQSWTGTALPFTVLDAGLVPVCAS